MVCELAACKRGVIPADALEPDLLITLCLIMISSYKRNTHIYISSQQRLIQKLDSLKTKINIVLFLGKVNLLLRFKKSHVH